MAVQIQICWLLQKPTDLDLPCLQEQGISRFCRTRAEFSETSNPAYFYAYFCFCTRKIAFRGFSFTLDCHRTSKLNFKDVPRTSEISFVRRNRYPRCPKNCQKARPLLTSCMMFAPPTYWKFATCVD